MRDSVMGLGRGRDAQKSLFQPISRHSDFRVTDILIFLPSFLRRDFLVAER